jgi:hypothetical protein
MANRSPNGRSGTVRVIQGRIHTLQTRKSAQARKTRTNGLACGTRIRASLSDVTPVGASPRWYTTSGTDGRRTMIGSTTFWCYVTGATGKFIGPIKW